MSHDELKKVIEGFNKNLGILIDEILESQELDGSGGCDVFNQISNILAYRCGQIEGFHLDHDAKKSGVAKMSAETILRGIKGSQENVMRDVLNGVNESLKHYGHTSLEEAAEVLRQKIAVETDDKPQKSDGDKKKKGKVYH